MAKIFCRRPTCRFFAPATENIVELIVPTLSVQEAFIRVSQQRGEGAALQSVALMQQGHVIDLEISIAVAAPKIGLEMKFPLADAVILATTKIRNTVVWTQDADFKNIDEVNFAN